MHHCLYFDDPRVHLEFIRLPRWTQNAIDECARQLTESGTISGVPCDENEFVMVEIEAYVDRIGYLASSVKRVVSITRYRIS